MATRAAAGLPDWLVAGLRGFGGFGIDGAFGELGQFFICGALFFESLAENVCGFVVTKTSSESARGAVPGNLVVLDALRRADESGVAHGVLGVFVDHVAAFFDEALHGLALVAGKGQAEIFADFFEALDMALGLFEVLLEAGFQVFVRGGLRHFWQGFHELRFGAVEVFEFLVEKVCERFEFHAMWVVI